MSVSLIKRTNADGTTSLILDVYHNKKRSYKFLKHLKLENPVKPGKKTIDPAIVKRNKDRIAQAEQIVHLRSLELAAGDYDMITDIGKKTLVVGWMQSYVDDYQKKDKRNMQGALNRFKDFLAEKKKSGLTFGRLDTVTISDFQDYLAARSVGEGASSYFARFKKMVARAVSEKLIGINPALGVRNKQRKARNKDHLTLEEIQTLANNPTEATEVKRAFLFSCMTGLRWVDIKALRWHSINGNQLKISQAKTGEDVSINLNQTAMKLLGERGDNNSLVFDLPGANGANKSLKAWVKRAGIDKKITWHNARHSAGFNLVDQGNDISTVMSLLGHTSLRHTKRYVEASKASRDKASDSLNIKL